MDIRQNNQEMSVKKKIQKDVHSSIPLILRVKWRHSNQPSTSQATNVREDGSLLDRIVSHNIELQHEEQVHRCLQGNQKIHLQSAQI